jgi:hypothetical protein
MTLVVKSWHSDVAPRDDGTYVEIIARESGLFSWVMTLFRIDPRHSLQIQYDKIIYESRSIWGYRRVMLPIASVSSLHFGYSKPWKLAAMILALFGTAGYVAMELEEPGWAAFLGLAGIIGAVTAFLLNKVLSIGVKEATGDDYDLYLKRSFIEGQEVNEESLGRITEIFVAVLDAHKARPSAS